LSGRSAFSRSGAPQPSLEAESARLRSTICRRARRWPFEGGTFNSQVLRQRFGLALAALEALVGRDEWNAVDAVAGVDARGFILAAGLAARMKKGFVPIRKAGKLPPPVERMEYRLEYGSGALEMQRGEGRLLLVDDVLATGGTLGAAAQLSSAAGYEVSALVVLIDLNIAGSPLWRGEKVRSVIQY
jgi:adenine phosphoribosyltransferase